MIILFQNCIRPTIIVNTSQDVTESVFQKTGSMCEDSLHKQGDNSCEGRGIWLSDNHSFIWQYLFPQILYVNMVLTKMHKLLKFVFVCFQDFSHYDRRQINYMKLYEISCSRNCCNSGNKVCL